MRLVFLGPPGSGKGTEAAIVSDRTGVPHLSTGDLFRDEIARGTDLGLRIERMVSGGGLVDDDLVNRVVFGRLKGLEGFILDGYPRTVAQAEGLDEHLSRGVALDAVVHLDVPDDEIEKRLAGRLVCPGCGYTGNLRHLEGEDAVDPSCPVCGERLIQRSDDTPEKVSKRLAVYREQTAPLLGYYESRMIEVDGVGSIEEVADRIMERIATWV